MSQAITPPVPRASTLPPDARRHFGPSGRLFVLFFTEMWERMSYYVMRALSSFT